ncbi:class III lanthionine synthetase LanKC [Alkalihalobacillus sp. NPDC078783]
MEGNMLYHRYLKEGTVYFEKSRSTRFQDDFELSNLPSDCLVSVDEVNGSPWKHYQFKGVRLPDQGWKIHVSANLDNAKQILLEISDVLIHHRVNFKHLRNVETLMTMNSKHANRSSSGKFMAIYPLNNDQFLFLLNQLHLRLESYEKGPYILSDKRWKEGNVYYRYGGFKSIYNEEGNLCIKDENGDLIPDKRTPFYHVPSFAQEFDEMLDSVNQREAGDNEQSRLDDYSMEKAIGFSNGGGIYLGVRKEDNLKVIIKEARPNAGLDAVSSDAVTRQKIEHDALVQLRDVIGVVNVIDYFKSWEHHFIVEEFIEGDNLHTWITKNYPFMKTASINEYGSKIKVILTKIVEIIEEMHKRNVAMGDLQPANIIVSNHLDVTLIDFETAKHVDSKEKPGMRTTGFSSNQIVNSGARDWYAFKKIIRFCLLPVSTSEDLDELLFRTHYRWIKKTYGEVFYKFVKSLRDKCDHQLSIYEEVVFKTQDDELNEAFVSTSSIIEGLKTGLEKNLIADQRLINGDIRQFELEGGKINVLTGGAGAAIALKRAGVETERIEQWKTKYLDASLGDTKEWGLFTGKTGVAVALFENGYREDAFGLLQNIEEEVDSSDISLRSGLSGIGLALISLYLEGGEPFYLQKAKSISTKVDSFINADKPFQVKDWSAVNIGLLDGWSGVSLFYSALYSVTKDENDYNRSLDLIKKDLDRSVRDQELDVLQTMDNQERLLPYLAGGSIGVGLAIWFLNQVSSQKHFQEELKQITNLSDIRCTISSGLLEGAGGFLLLPSLNDEKETYTYQKESVLELLRLFLIEKDNHLVFPGQFGFRLSDDLYSGSTGVLLALIGLERDNPLYWMPLVNPDTFIKKIRI